MARGAPATDAELSTSEISILWRRHVPSAEGELTFEAARNLFVQIHGQERIGDELTETMLARSCAALGILEGQTMAREEFLRRFNTFWQQRNDIFGTPTMLLQADLKAELHKAHNLSNSEAGVVERCEQALQAERRRVFELQSEVSMLSITGASQTGDAKQLASELLEARELRQEAAMAADQALSLRRKALLEEEQVSSSLMSTRIAAEQARRIQSKLTSELQRAEDEANVAAEDRMLQSVAEDKVAFMRSRVTAEYRSARAEFQQAQQEKRQSVARARSALQEQEGMQQSQAELVEELRSAKEELRRRKKLQSPSRSTKALQLKGEDAAADMHSRMHHREAQSREPTWPELEPSGMENLRSGGHNVDVLLKENQKLRLELRDLSSMTRAVPGLEVVGSRSVGSDVLLVQEEDEVRRLRQALQDEETSAAKLRRERDRLGMELKDLSNGLSQRG